MTDPNFIILYINSPVNSTVFYEDLFGKKSIEESPTFDIFALGSGVMLGLWPKHTVEPAAIATAGCGELAFAVASNDMVNAMHADWSGRGLTTLQAPTDMDFGYTFVELDPDGHRLRVLLRLHDEQQLDCCGLGRACSDCQSWRFYAGLSWQGDPIATC